MKTALQFSGGRDSLVALFLLEPFWSGMTVAWCDPGDSARELVMLMEKVERTVPHFARIEGCAPATRKRFGDPTAKNWPQCCNDSIWQPMQRWVKASGVRWLVRGVRKVDPVPWPEPAAIIAGIEFIMPLWDWTDAMRESALKDIARRGFVPVYPHDCLHCPVVKICDRPELRNVA